MLEIPDIERVRRVMDKQWVGQRIREVHVQRDSWIGMPLAQLAEGVTGKQLLYVERRGKALIFHLDDGRRLFLQVGHGGIITCENDQDSRTTVMGETASITSAEQDEDATVEQVQRVAKPQLTITFDQGSLAVTGARSLSLQWITAKELDDQLKKWGPDPLSRHLSAKVFQNRFSKRRTALKTALSNPELVAGLTPVTVDEICYRAGILPYAKTEQLTTEDWEALHAAMVTWLQEAIEHPEGQLYHLNGRLGERCPRCEGTIADHAIGGKTALYCPNCQDEHVSSPSNVVQHT